jgi:plasmid stabilization system protein ParE
MAQVVWTSEAEEDLTEIASFISIDSEHYATVFVLDIFQAAERLAGLPADRKSSSRV